METSRMFVDVTPEQYRAILAHADRLGVPGPEILNYVITKYLDDKAECLSEGTENDRR